MRPFAELDDWASDDQPQSAVINGSNEELPTSHRAPVPRHADAVDHALLRAKKVRA
jgi:hypothetical protein